MPHVFNLMMKRRDTKKLLREKNMTEEFPVLANLLDRSLKRKDFWADRGFNEFEVGETTDTQAEAKSNADIEHSQ